MAKRRVPSWGLRWCKFLEWLGVPWEWEHPSDPSLFKVKLVSKFLEAAYCELTLAEGPSKVFYRSYWASFSANPLEYKMSAYWSMSIPAKAKRFMFLFMTNQLPVPYPYGGNVVLCPLCKGEADDAFHLLCECTYLT